MKKLLIAALFSLSAGAISAQTLFNPSFGSGSTPAGLTPTTNSSGTITYADGQATFGDVGVNGNLAYLSGESTAGEGANSITSTFTFTPHYTVGTGNQANIIVFSLYSSQGANNPLIQLDFQPLGYNTQGVNLLIDGGIAFGGGSKGAIGNVPDPTRVDEYTSKPESSLNGVALTFNLVTTFADAGGNATITTNGTVSDSSGVLQTYHITTTGSDNGGGFDPAANSILLYFGDGSTLPGRSPNTSDNDGILNTGATVSFSSLKVSVTPALTIPEPSSYALMLGSLALLAWIARRRLMA